MKLRVPINLFLVSSIFGLVTGADRHQKEIEKLRQSGDLEVYDGNSKLVKITTDESGPKTQPKPVKFFLYTKHGDKVYDELLVPGNVDLLKKSHFHKDAPTRFVTHGWMNSGTSTSCTIPREGYLNTEKGNVIVADWSDVSHANYVWAAGRIGNVAEQIAKMVDFVAEKGPVDHSKITLIGHSMGAHVMGLTGQHIKRPVNHIIGLDPAAPMFNYASDNERLSKNDAKHVQVIHTDVGRLGTPYLLGHSDFFINGGAIQPGCCNNNGPVCNSCSHKRAIDILGAAIRKPIDAVQCDTYDHYKSGECSSHQHTSIDGLHLDRAKPGKYYANAD